MEDQLTTVLGKWQVAQFIKGEKGRMGVVFQFPAQGIVTITGGQFTGQ